MLLVKVAERRATLLGLNAPIGHAVVVQAPPTNQRSIDAMQRSLDRLMALRRQGETSAAEPAVPPVTSPDDSH